MVAAPPPRSAAGTVRGSSEDCGKRADLVLLDAERYIDPATYENPKRSPDGVLGVWVAGERVIENGGVTGARHGGVAR